MAAAGVPTAAHRVVTTVDEGLAAVDGYPAVIKADGLAAGKGVVIAADEGEARAALEDMLVARRFGDLPVVVEEFMAGEELSLLALCDGERAVPLAPARDYKRIGDGDTGPNTGGMGCLLAGAGGRRARARRHRLRPPARRRRAGAPRHAVPRRPLRRADAHGRRREGASSSTCASAIPRRRWFSPGCARTCSRCCWRRWSRAGSRGSSSSGIRGPRCASCWRRAAIRRARRRATRSPASTGCRRGSSCSTRAPPSAAEEVVTAGGRVLGVTALGDDRAAARAAAYAAADMIAFEGAQLRRDIAS